MENLKNKQNSDEIAIIGIGCRFPGDIVDLSSFWQAICQKKETVSRILPTRWNWKTSYDKDNNVIAKSFFLNASFLTQPIDEFEPLFFGMSPKEAVQCDPQQRILLEVAWEALEEGGLVPSDYAGKKVGVFVGVFATDWLTKQSTNETKEGNIERNFIATTLPTTMLSARLSYFFDFCGPSLVLDTACSSSLTAIYLACQSLRNGDSDMTLAGGVNLILTDQAGSIVAKAHFMAEDGKSKSFDASADGYGRGEGCGVIILKRLQDALRDNDKIHAVISGIGINQDGHNEGLTVPNAVAQEKLIRSVANQAKVDLRDIAYVEAHGTGTPVGDPLEAQAISNTIGQSRPQNDPVIIGSVKANIGHLEAAAGVAGLIKACLCLEHQAVPPQANLKEPNPHIPFEKMNLRLIQNNVVSLDTTSKVLYAAVNSFGYGGSNACAILRSPLKTEKITEIHSETVYYPSNCYILSLSSKQQPSLKLIAERYVEFLKKENNSSLEDICYSVGKHRSFFPKHLVTFGKNKQEFIQNLEDFINDKPNPDVIIGNQQIKTQTQPVFVFSGMGPQWWGMGQWLLTQGSAESIALAKECDHYFYELSGWSILAEMQKNEKNSRIQETSIAQPAIFLIQICIATALKLYGIKPSAIVGHSVGEIAAAFVAGALNLKDAVTVIYHRSRLQQTFAGRGSMLAVGLPPSAATKLMDGYEGDVAVAAINSPRSFTLSGSKKSLEKIAAELQKRSEFNRFLKVELPYHNPVMTEIQDKFEQALENIQPSVATIPLYSTVTGRICDDTFFHDANYWYRNLKQTVLFAEAISTMLHDGYALFLEVGPHPVLSASVKECAAALNISIATVHSFHRKEPENKALAKSLASLSAAGLQLDWDKLVSGQRVDLPFYRWAKEVYLTESNHSKAIRFAERLNPVLGNVDWAASRGWLSELNMNYLPWLSDHKVEGMIVLPAAAYIEAALAAHAQLAIDAPNEIQEPAIVEDLKLKKAMVIEQGFYPYMTWSFDDFTGRLLAYGRTKNDSPEWDLYSTISLRRSIPWAKEEKINIAALRKQHSEAIDPTIFYTKLMEHGLEYGSVFQTIHQLYYGQQTALAHLRIAESEKDKVIDYYLHPTLLDGAFQLFGLLCAKEQSADTTFIPVSIERVMYFGKHEGDLYAYAHHIERDDDCFIGDIDLYTLDGEVIAKVKGLAVKEITSHRQKEAKQMGWLYHREWQKVESLALLGEIAQIALITDNEAFTHSLVKELESQGVTVLLGKIGEQSGLEGKNLFKIRKGNKKDYQDFFQFIDINKCRAIVYCYTQHQTKDVIGLSLVQESLILSQSLPVIEDKQISEHFRFIVITNGAEQVLDKEDTLKLDQSSLRGFIKAFAFERPELKLKMIDVDADLQGNPTVLAAEILDDQSEDDVALRRDDRFVARLTSFQRQEDVTLVPYEQLDHKTIGFRLVQAFPGMIDKLRYDAFVRQPPPPGHVELEILNASLNFKDVLKVMGLLPRVVIKNTYHQDSLGMEASVRIVAVGEGAEKDGFYVGDRLVVSLRGCLKSHITLATKDLHAVHYNIDALIREANRYGLTAEQIHRIKEVAYQVPDAEASTVPIVFSTAYHTLVNLANLQKGQTVLIHAAAGGLGLAAIQIAKMRGARIFATAGNDKKRQYLRDLGCEYVWNSRDLEFVDGVKQATGGKGVDVILNSLSGEALHHSLDLVAPFGSFCEVGKRDIAEDKWMPMRAFNENINFYSMDLDRMGAVCPEKVVDIVVRVTREIIVGNIIIPTCTVFPTAKTVEAFRNLASAQHIGKIVIDFTNVEGLKVKPFQKEMVSILPEALYMITGAYGGMGFELVQWLVQRGAKNLVLIGRSLKEDDEQIQSVLKSLQEHGIFLHQVQADITNYQALKKVMEEVKRLPYALKGIFHCAAVIDDGVVENLEPERVTKVMLPKAQGAWNLHELSKDIDLDYFVLFSSATHLFGNIGQAAYIAANAFLDGLAYYRRQMGLPALSIEWGAIDGGRMLQKDSHTAKNFESFGITPLPVKQALDIIPLLWKLDSPCLGVIDVNWSKWFNAFPVTRSYSRFQALVALGNISGEQTEILRQLNALPVEERLAFVVENLIDILAKTLQLSKDSIDGNTRLTELGIDSLVGVELQIAISNTLGCEISLLQLMKEENLQDVGKVLLRKLKISFESHESLTLETKNEAKE